MKDRISKNPGRVLVAPENGQEAYYAILSMADNPVQEGMKLNKANVLSDVAEEMFGFNDATPSQVFERIGQIFKQNEPILASVADRLVYENGSYKSPELFLKNTINTSMRYPAFIIGTGWKQVDTSSNTGFFIANNCGYGVQSYGIGGFGDSGALGRIETLYPCSFTFFEHKIELGPESQISTPSVTYNYTVVGLA